MKDDIHYQTDYFYTAIEVPKAVALIIKEQQKYTQKFIATRQYHMLYGCPDGDLCAYCFRMNCCIQDEEI